MYCGQTCVNPSSPSYLVIGDQRQEWVLLQDFAPGMPRVEDILETHTV